MSSTEKSVVYAQLKEKFPTATNIEIAYEGSGDSFGDFWEVTAYDADGKEIKDASTSDILNIVEDYCHEIFDMSGQPNFNDDGSEGYIKFDILNQVTTLDNYEKYTDTRHTGTEYF